MKFLKFFQILASLTLFLANINLTASTWQQKLQSLKHKYHLNPQQRCQGMSDCQTIKTLTQLLNSQKDTPGTLLELLDTDAMTLSLKKAELLKRRSWLFLWQTAADRILYYEIGVLESNLAATRSLLLDKYPCATAAYEIINFHQVDALQQNLANKSSLANWIRQHPQLLQTNTPIENYYQRVRQDLITIHQILASQKNREDVYLTEKMETTKRVLESIISQLIDEVNKEKAKQADLEVQKAHIAAAQAKQERELTLAAQAKEQTALHKQQLQTEQERTAHVASLTSWMQRHPYSSHQTQQAIEQSLKEIAKHEHAITQHTKLHRDIQQYKHDLEQKQKEIELKNKEIRLMIQNSPQLQAEISQQNREKLLLENRLSAINAELTTARQTHANEHRIYQPLIDQRTNLKERITELRSSIATKEKELQDIHKVAAQSAQLNDNISELKSIERQLSNQYAMLLSQIAHAPQSPQDIAALKANLALAKDRVHPLWKQYQAAIRKADEYIAGDATPLAHAVPVHSDSQYAPSAPPAPTGAASQWNK